MNDEIKVLIESVNTACQRFESDGWNQPLWDALERIGVTLLPVPEKHGGAGADFATTGAVLRALGRNSVSVPLVETALLAGWMLSACGHRVPEGPLSAAVAGPDVDLRRQGDAWVMTGRLPRVPWAQDVSVIVVLTTSDHGTHLVLLDRTAVDLEPGRNVAGEPRDDLILDAVQLTQTQVLPIAPDSGVTVGAFRERGALGRALLMAGAAERVLELTVNYIGERVQFGRSLNKFQVTQQQVAQQAGEVAAARISAEAAALELDANGRAGFAVAAAKARGGEAAGVVTRIGHQLHGAIGFTDEHELHLCTTRLWAWRDEYGNEDEWSTYLGEHAMSARGAGLWPLLTKTS